MTGGPPAAAVLRYWEPDGRFWEEWHCEPPGYVGQGYRVLADSWVTDPASGAVTRRIHRVEWVSEP